MEDRSVTAVLSANHETSIPEARFKVSAYRWVCCIGVMILGDFILSALVATGGGVVPDGDAWCQHGRCRWSAPERQMGLDGRMFLVIFSRSDNSRFDQWLTCSVIER